MFSHADDVRTILPDCQVQLTENRVTLSTMGNDTIQGFHLRLRELLRESDVSGWTLSDQARFLGISKALLSQWLSGRTAAPTFSIARRVAERLGARVEWLLENDGLKRRADSAAEEKGGVTTSTGARMNLQQQQATMIQLLEDLPATARERLLTNAVREALQKGWIDQVPDSMAAYWSAREILDGLKKKSN